jgi:hypothetical protein
MIRRRSSAISWTLVLASAAFATVASADRPPIELPPQSQASPELLVPATRASAAHRAPSKSARAMEPSPIPQDMPRPSALASDLGAPARASGLPVPEIGGDDRVISAPGFPQDVAVASNGDLYVAFGYIQNAPIDEWIDVYRSQDGGDTFQFFGRLGTIGDFDRDRLVRIQIAEGIEDRLFVLYMRSSPSGPGFIVECAYAELSGVSAVWNRRPVFTESGVTHFMGDFVSDAVHFQDYYLYAVTAGLDDNGGDIWFSRSTDFGNTWSPAYRIAEISSASNERYWDPRIDYGFGGAIHVTWTHIEQGQDLLDDGVLYRRALDYADSPASWDPSAWSLFGTTDGVDQIALDVAASTTSNVVWLSLGELPFYLNPRVVTSPDAGASWTPAVTYDLPWQREGELEYRPSTGEFVGVGSDALGGLGIYVVTAVAPHVIPPSWSGMQRFADEETAYLPQSRVAFDPTRGDRAAVVWTGGAIGGPATAYFDAEWRGDSGYPNLETGFPVDLGNVPDSPPAIANLDADPFGEIVFGDDAGYVRVYNHDGTARTGWPRLVGPTPPGGPVAIADLNGHGEPAVVVGTADGRVVAMAPDGGLLPGFPVDLGTNAATFVSIGRLGNPDSRGIVACSGTDVFLITGTGQVDPIVWNFTGPHHVPAAIGDVDDDGITEIVSVKGPVPGSEWFFVHVTTPGSYDVEMFRAFPTNTIFNQPVLADLDLDGDLEIIVSTGQGLLFAMHHTGADVTGWPWSNGTGSPLTGASAAQFVGGPAPDLAVASQDGRLHVLFSNGTQQAGYPRPTDVSPGAHRAPPTLDQIHQEASNPIIGSTLGRAWTFSNLGATVPGWPRELGGDCELSAASGDLDLDGRNEIVFLTESQLVVVDVGHPPAGFGGERWPMLGNDPGRRSCLECDDAVVEDAPFAAPAGRIVFRPPTPNPSRGSVALRYELPQPAAVILEVFDVSGRRVCTVVKREQPASEHTAVFDGRDDAGARLPGGLYFARLQVRGPGMRDTVTRRFSLLH